MHARARAQATVQFSSSTSDNVDPATTQPPGQSTFQIISASSHIMPPVSNKRPPSATVTDDNEEVLSDSVPVKSKKSKQKRACNEASVFSYVFFFDNPCSSQLFSFITDDSHNEGMHRDMNIMCLLIIFLCIIFHSLFIFPIMSRGLSPSWAQAGPRPWKQQLQSRQAWALLSWALAGAFRPSQASTTLISKSHKNKYVLQLCSHFVLQAIKHLFATLSDGLQNLRYLVFWDLFCAYPRSLPLIL